MPASLNQPEGDSQPSASPAVVSAGKQTIIRARVPRLLVKSGRTVTTRVPWAAPRGRFTLWIQAHIITLLQHCRTVREEARLARIAEDGQMA